MAVVGSEPSISDKVPQKIEREDVFRRLVWRVKRLVSFLVFYVVIVLGNLFLLIWELSGTAIWTVAITLEALINVVFLVEVIVEIITQDDYFSKCWNILDLTICMLCIISFIVTIIYDDVSDDNPGSLYSTSIIHHVDEDEIDDSNTSDTGTVQFDMNHVDMVLLLIRYIVQSTR